MASSPSPGEQTPSRHGFRRSSSNFASLPHRSLSFHERAGLESSDAKAEVLYSHSSVRIYSFNPPTDSIKDLNKAQIPPDTDYPVDAVETLPWRSRTETLSSAGTMIIEKIRGSATFFKASDFLHPLMRNSQCWLVDGESKFVLRVGKLKYWRIELPNANEEEKAKVEELKGTLKNIVRFEKTPCPFIRAFHVDLPDDAITPRRKGTWKRQESAITPHTSDTELRSSKENLRKPRTPKDWGQRTLPPSSFPSQAFARKSSEGFVNPLMSATASANALSPAALRRRLTERSESPASFNSGDDSAGPDRNDTDSDGRDEEQEDNKSREERIIESVSAVDPQQEVTNTGEPKQSKQSADEEVSSRECVPETVKSHLEVQELEPRLETTAEPTDREDQLFDGRLAVKLLDDQLPPAVVLPMQQGIQSAQAQSAAEASDETEGRAAHSAVEAAVSTDAKEPEAPYIKEVDKCHQDVIPQHPVEEVLEMNEHGNAEADLTEEVRKESIARLVDKQIEPRHEMATERIQKNSVASSPANAAQTEEESTDSSASSSEASDESDLEAETGLAEPQPEQGDTSPSVEEDRSLMDTVPSKPLDSDQGGRSIHDEVAEGRPSVSKSADADENLPLIGSIEAQISEPTLNDRPEATNEADRDDMSDVSADSFYTIEASDIRPSQHRRGLSEMTVTGPKISEAVSTRNLPASPEASLTSQSQTLMDTPQTPSLLKSTGSDSSWPDVETPSYSNTVPPVSEAGRRLKDRRSQSPLSQSRSRSLSPLPPSSTIVMSSPEEYDHDRHARVAGMLMRKAATFAVVKPIEVVVLFVHVLARIAGGATVNDLMNGDLFRRPRHQRTATGIFDRGGQHLSLRSGTVASEDDKGDDSDVDSADDFGVHLPHRRTLTFASAQEEILSSSPVVRGRRATRDSIDVHDDAASFGGVD